MIEWVGEVGSARIAVPHAVFEEAATLSAPGMPRRGGDRCGLVRRCSSWDQEGFLSLPFRVEREATTAVGFVLGEQCCQFTQMIYADRRCIEVSPRLQHAADL